jgi:hypothetical protein
MSKSTRRQSGGSLVGGALGLVVLLSFLSSNSEGFSKALGALLGGALFLGTTAAAIWVAWRLWRRLGTPRARDLHKRFEAVRSMSGTQFEVFMADLFRALGHRAVVLGGAGGRYRRESPRRTRRRAVQEPQEGRGQWARAGGLRRCKAPPMRGGLRCAPAGYTRGATELAGSTGVSLYDGEAIRRWIRKVDALERERERTGGARQQTERPGGRPARMEEAAEDARKRAIYHPHPDDPPRN